MAKQKTHPSSVLADALREAGDLVALLWEMPGPKNTAIAWLSGYAVNGRVIIVQTYGEGHGWDVYSASPAIGIEETIRDVRERCPR